MDRAARIGTIAVTIIMLALLAGSAPNAAFHDPNGATIIDERAIEGPFWFVYKINVSEPSNVASWELVPEYADGSSSGYSLWLLSVNDVRSPFAFHGVGGSGTSQLDIRQEEPVPLEEQSGPYHVVVDPTNHAAATSRNLPVDDYWLVIMNMAPNAATTEIKLYGDDAVSVIATGQGTEGGYQRETQFETPNPYVHIQVGASAGASGIGAQFQMNHMTQGHVNSTIENSLFGLFAASHLSDVRNLSIVMPNGMETPVSQEGRQVFTDREAGEWTFKVNEWTVEPRVDVGPHAWLLAQWADVELP